MSTCQIFQIPNTIKYKTSFDDHRRLDHILKLIFSGTTCSASDDTGFEEILAI